MKTAGSSEQPRNFELELPAPDIQASEELTLLQKSKTLDDGNGQHQNPQRPWSAWVVLVIAIVCVSSAAVTFASMQEVPPVTLAAWVSKSFLFSVQAQIFLSSCQSCKQTV